MQSTRIHITGIVQGVGFRPFVYNLAARYGLKGWCLNDSAGVVIEVQGPSVDSFINEIRTSAPPLSRIEEMTVERLEDTEDYSAFTIRESRAIDGKFVLVSPDVALCNDCLSEMLDPADRRYQYPFINCTNCGPRYSIVLDIPYDRPKTTMAPFIMCADCEREYRDPPNRRFHAEPNACPECGPRAWLHGGADMFNDKAIREAERLLKEGAILAIKGLGGFHLACDAENPDAVKRLRDRKRGSLKREAGSNKPFALMAPDAEAVRSFCELSDKEERALTGRTRPIVLLKKRTPHSLDEAVAPGNNYFGVMLPYTPLHHLLFGSSSRGRSFRALVMTSGNLSEEPIVVSNEEALNRLSKIADHFLLHDRDIYMRVDDSIAKVEEGRTKVLRRARGLAPDPIDLGEDMEEIFAAGALLKNTFCLTKGRNAIVSQHIGDLENVQALEFYEETLRNLKNTFRAEPVAVAHDMHPDYLSTRFALDYAREKGIAPERIIAVQHHHAHIASAMAEHNLSGEVIGISFDGTGFGTDGKIWGGEFLAASRRAFRRAAHLKYMRLPGGDMAIREPWRTAVSCLIDACGDIGALRGFKERIGPNADVVAAMVQKDINSPLTSSMGRLFDAVASIAGIRDEITFEAEAAIELENIAQTGAEAQPYQFIVKGGSPAQIDAAPMIRNIVDDVNGGVPKAVIAGRFHATVAELALKIAESIRKETGLERAVLSGGVFQNRLLFAMTNERLLNAGFKVYSQERLPANDGGISLGQAAVAWERIKGR